MKRKRKTYLLLIGAWIFLIAGGVWGTKAYSDHIQDQVTQQLKEETSSQLKVIQEDYQNQITALKSSLEGNMGQLQTKVDSLTEVLAFIKDSANTKTDNSNQLYSQLEEVKKQLDELKAQLDVLK